MQDRRCFPFRLLQASEGKRLSKKEADKRDFDLDNAPQESFFCHMKDEIGSAMAHVSSFEEAKALIDDWMDYYNNDRGQWLFAKLSPNEFYEYCNTGIYPLITHSEPDSDSS